MARLVYEWAKFELEFSIHLLNEPNSNTRKLGSPPLPSYVYISYFLFLTVLNYQQRSGPNVTSVFTVAETIGDRFGQIAQLIKLDK